jgi:hypothetical protein
MDKEKDRELHIGGKAPHPEWEIFDAMPDTYVDHHGDAKPVSSCEFCGLTTIRSEKNQQTIKSEIKHEKHK